MSSFNPSSNESDVSSTLSSPYRRRFERQTRREALEHRLRGSPRCRGVAHNSEESQRSLVTDQPESLMEHPQANFFGGSTTRRSGVQHPEPLVSDSEDVGEHAMAYLSLKADHDDEKKSSISGGTTVTTASSTTQSPLNGYSALPDDASDQTPLQASNRIVDDEGETSRLLSTPSRRKPQHLETHEEESEIRYYRITYQGVVALLSNPERNSPRSGAYVSYGEIIASRYELDMEWEESTSSDVTQRSSTKSVQALKSPVQSDAPLSPESPPRSVLSHTAGSVSSLDTLRTTSTTGPSQIGLTRTRPTTVTKKMIRVDGVLTGGYAVDASDVQQLKEESSLETPKRSNAQYFPIVGPSPLPLGDNSALGIAADTALQERAKAREIHMGVLHYGFLSTRRKNMTIAERIPVPPLLQSGKFMFKIVSSTPLSILTGPCLDAPKTRAMLLPGTVHEVCLKMTTEDSDVCFLRLSHRRGWISDRKFTASGGAIKVANIPAVKEIADFVGGYDPDESTISALSMASSSNATAESLTRRRHRPPRRKRETMSGGMDSIRPPRQLDGYPVPFSPGTPKSKRSSYNETPRKVASPGHTDKAATPSSNVSMLSDEESFDLSSHYRSVGGITPDRSVTREQQEHKSVAPSFFLMRVNAPWGLKILDAPHFQVSNLIHGKQDQSKGIGTAHGESTSSGSQSIGSNSIFQTMAGSHTTKGTNKIGNPAVFDSVRKTRMLPRGALFEASKRIEPSGAFSEGAGLIKLSDNSGWAIIPRQEELDLQYRNYHGGVASIKEGEATRAFEEVGNAIVDTNEQARQTKSYRWLRIVARNGVSVACPPPSPPLLNDEDSPPTSSTEGSSIVSGMGSNFGILSNNDSDVASSVGSAFLDAMFRTPKKPEPMESARNRERSLSRKGHHTTSRVEPRQAPTLVPCGLCVEVESWQESPGHSMQYAVCQEYVRLRAGQGWIPLKVGGKSTTVDIPKPDVRIGSFWFRVMSQRGIKVRLGPSRKAGSIKSDDGVYFRFECGEFLRASEVLTFFHNGAPSESFAKLYRNRHVQFNSRDIEYRQLASLTTPAEWVQVHDVEHLFMEECGDDPQIQRHKEGWRFNVVAESGVQVRSGPSFAAETSGIALLAGESVLVNERVTAPGERVSWLRLMDGKGWVHDLSLDGEAIMIAHSLRHRSTGALTRPRKADRVEADEIAYNTIIARLFHGDNEPGLPTQYLKK